MRKNRLWELFRTERPAYAGWMSFDSAYAAELVGSSGFDAVVIDGQHGMAGFECQVRMLQALSHTPVVPMVRVSHNNLAEINRVLDAGAYGVICPLVNSAAEASAFARACRYPLNGVAGDRSMGPARGLLYGGAEYAHHANAEILALAMVETREGLDALEAIVSTPHLDGVFVGPTDLGIALGLGPGASQEEPVLAEALAHIAAVCRALGRVAGIWCSSADIGRKMVKLGYRFVAPGHDALCLKAEIARRLEVLHA
jgi:4-hydroxy-2-oxoheptanedioate aldolase